MSEYLAYEGHTLGPSSYTEVHRLITVNHPAWLKTYVRWSLCALACSVSLGVALVSISKLLILLGFMGLLVHDARAFFKYHQETHTNTKARLIKHLQSLPVGLKSLGVHFRHLRTPSAVLLALTWMTLSLNWTEALSSEWPISLTRHSRILFIPLILYCLRSKHDVLMVLRAMILTQLGIVLYSYLLWFGVPLLFSNPLYPRDFGVVINGHLEQPIMSTLMVVLAWSFRHELWPRWGLKFIYAICALGAFNVFFIMTGRTGFIAMLLAITFALYQEMSHRYPKWRSGVWVLPLIMACTLGLLSERFNSKVVEAFHDITLYSQGNDATSQGYRLDYWKQSLKAISDSPLVGHGVGSWRQEYIAYGGNEPNAPTNPHQQFLLWTVEAGLVGLVLLLNFFWALLKDAQSLTGPAKDAMMSALGIVLMVSLFNCPFYGAGIGEFFILIFASMAALYSGQPTLHKNLSELRANPVQLPWIERLGLRVVSQPLSVMVSGNEEDYAQSEGLSKLGWRQLRKIVYLHLHRQAHLQQNKADPQWKRGLWIYQRTPQIGDSLMDLAPRDLFMDRGIEVDLMIPQSLMPLFEGDKSFKHIYTTPAPDIYGPYDFILIQSLHHRSLYKKIKHFPKLPWVCIQGDYDVPNFARSRFVTQRLCDLFSWSLSDQAFAQHAKQKLSTQLSSIHNTGVEPDRYPLTITLGGMDPSRIYFQWLEVISQLQNKGFDRCLLIGSGEQAQQTSDAITKAFNSVMTIENLVNQVSLQECQALIARTQLLITADGGLMHLGVATGCQRIISLFTKSILPAYRLSEEYLQDALQSPSDAINDIEPQWIVEKVMAQRRV